MNSIPSLLLRLRREMERHGLSAWIIPTADPHLSEYLPEHWQARRVFSGFDGSAGTLVLTETQAQLWTDSRYWEQAALQLSGSGIELCKQIPSRHYIDALADMLPVQACAGIAPDMLSLSVRRRFQAAFADKGIRLCCDKDIAADIWADRPPLPKQPVYLHQAACVGADAADKLAQIRQEMAREGADFHLISSLDDIGWLCNLRGSDVPYNPVFLAYLLIGREHAVLFADSEKFGEAELARLHEAGIRLCRYEDVGSALAELSGSLMLDADKTAVATLSKLPEQVRLIERINPSALLKSQKNDREMNNIRQAMLQDGIALCGFFAEWEDKLARGVAMTECDIGEMLIAHRSQREAYVSPSFETIAGFNRNGALPHYRAEPETCSEIKGQGLLLIDSGAQYHSGTTDITRVVAVGTPTAEQKRDFTLVLKAHIALAQAVFPENLPAPMLDAVCRAPLWQEQCDYGHGTGHGVGYFMNVHEGPQVISYYSIPTPNHALKEGMLTSNEPGLYRSGKWGIRIENLVLCRKAEPKENGEFGEYLYFETVTLCPIDTRLVNRDLLNDGETAWLNGYHARVRDALLPYVEGAARDWLLAATGPI